MRTDICVKMLKMQYVILKMVPTVQIQKYWRELFLLPPPPQMQHSHRLPDWGHATERDQLTMEVVEPYTVRWWVDHLHFNIPLVIELFRWMQRPWICDLWPILFAGFHGCNMLCFPPTGNLECQKTYWLNLQWAESHIPKQKQTFQHGTHIPKQNNWL